MNLWRKYHKNSGGAIQMMGKRTKRDGRWKPTSGVSGPKTINYKRDTNGNTVWQQGFQSSPLTVVYIYVCGSFYQLSVVFPFFHFSVFLFFLLFSLVCLCCFTYAGHYLYLKTAGIVTIEIKRSGTKTSASALVVPLSL